MKLNLLFNLSYLNSNFALSLEYLNPALNNPVLYPYMTWHAKEQAYSVLVKSSQWSIINAAFWLVALLLSYMLWPTSKRKAPALKSKTVAAE